MIGSEGEFMSFTQIEMDYLASQPLGRLATIQPDGTPQISPVGFTYNAGLGTIDIGGHEMSKSWKFRNLRSNDKVAFVVDDIVSTDPWRVRCLEIRGVATGIENPAGTGGAIIRVWPRRIISFGIGAPDIDPHLLKPSKRDVGV
jgi:pyridoxamine 5'-phosphate oxidase family protein